jgi:putative membrane protein
MKKFLCEKFPLILFGIYLVEFVALAVKPYSRVMWCTENFFSLAIVIALVILYRKGVKFSNVAYLLMAIYLYCHTIGGHYTFARVPFSFVTEFFGFERNNFDRMCHFMVGFFAYAGLEYYESRNLIKGRALAIFLVIMAIFGVAAVFELVEWLYAEVAAPEAGADFLGSQGDIWDAQKDMLCDGTGAIFSSIIYLIVNRKK